MTCPRCGEAVGGRATFCGCGRALPALRAVNLSPKVSSTRTPQVPRVPREPMNSWQRGIAGEYRRDGSFMPYIDGAGVPYGVHDFQSHRGDFERAGLA